MNILTINDETSTGRILNQVMLYFQKDKITVRQLLKERLLEEKRDNQTSFRAFRQHGFHIRINNRQVESLEQQIQLTNETRVSFVELH